MQLYRHSGAVPLFGGLFCLVGAVFSGLGIGVLNAYAVHWSPIGIMFFLCIPIPVNYLLTVACAATCGWLMRSLRWHGRIRSGWFIAAATAFAFVFWLWAYWSVSQIASGRLQPGWECWSPVAIFSYGKLLLQKDGGWVIAWWIFEALSFAATLTICVLAERDQPFCERCEWWTVTTPSFMLFQSNEHDEVWQQFRVGDITALERLPVLTVRSIQYMRLNLASCKTCDTSRFVSVQKISPSAFRKDREEGKVVEATFIPYYALTADEWKYVQCLMEPPADGDSQA